MKVKQTTIGLWLGIILALSLLVYGISIMYNINQQLGL